MQDWQLTALRLAATLGIVAVLAAIVGFAVASKHEALMPKVRGLVITCVLLALVAGGAAAIGEVWR